MTRKLILFFSIGSALAVGALPAASAKDPKEVHMKIYQYGEPVAYKPGANLQFSDFTIRFTKEVDPEKNSEIKTTASVRGMFFQIKDRQGKKQTIEVVYGQNPPLPYDFMVNSEKFTLYTFHSPKGERLFPDKLVITKNK